MELRKQKVSVVELAFERMESRETGLEEAGERWQLPRAALISSKGLARLPLIAAGEDIGEDIFAWVGMSGVWWLEVL